MRPVWAIGHSQSGFCDVLASYAQVWRCGEELRSGIEEKDAGADLRVRTTFYEGTAACWQLISEMLHRFLFHLISAFFLLVISQTKLT
jgi:predicted secreted protein